MKKSFSLLFILLLCTLRLPAQPVNGYIHSDTGNLTVIKLYGSHYERGYAYGYLCADKLSAIWNNYLLPTYGTYLPLARAIVGNPNYFDIDAKYTTEAQAMIDGMAAAGQDTSGISYLDLFVVNFITDLEGFLPKMAPWQQCSSLLDWGTATAGTDLDGRSVIAHYLDAAELDTSLTQNQVLVVHFPAEPDEQPWLMTGIVGQFVASQAVNSAGIATFLNTVNGFNAQINMGYEPMTLAIRKAMETRDYNGDGADNTNDLRAALNSNTNGYARGFIVCAVAPSTAGNDSLIAMVAECAPQVPYITFRNINDVDSIEGTNLYAANSMIKRENAQDYCSRYLNVSDSINAYFNGVNIGSFDNWEIMRTQSTQITNLQFIQVIPETGHFQIAVSEMGVPAYQQTPMSFNLNDLFVYSSVAETGASAELDIFPNPTTGCITIREKFAAAVFFEVLDISGRSQCSGKLNARQEIDLRDLSAGLFILRIHDGRSTRVVKIVKF